MTLGIAITGAGCLCAAGATLGAAFEALLAGVRAPAPPRRIQTDHPVRYPMFEVRDFDGPPELLRTSALGLEAARQALADAGWSGPFGPGLRVGILMGTTVACALNDEAYCRAYRAGAAPDPGRLTRILRSNPARVIAEAVGAEGPVQTLVNACASGTDAVGLGAAWIREGICDVVLAGGADELSRITANGFISMRIADEAPCRPFDGARRGLNLGEGAAVLVLESEDAWRRRGARVRGRVLGYGAASDAHHPTAPHPEGLGLRAAIQAALAEAGLPPGALAFVNAHGTGTADNDRVEAKVLAELLPGVPYASTKGGTGHTLGAAGAIEAALTLAGLERGEMPGSLGFVQAGDDVPVPPVATRHRLNGTVALSQSLAFGGSNSALVLAREAP